MAKKEEKGKIEHVSVDFSTEQHNNLAKKINEIIDILNG